MGELGFEPGENEAALIWLDIHVEQPLINTIERTLKSFIEAADQSIDEDEVEVAVALLIDCTSGSAQWPYGTLDLCPLAKKRGAWDLAIRAVGKLIAGLPASGQPDEKLAVLERLRAELEGLKEVNRDLQVLCDF